MRTHTIAGLAITLLLSLAACGSQPAPQGSANTSPARIPPDLIVRPQFEGSGFQNAYAIVEALHGNWLRERSAGFTDARGQPQGTPPASDSMSGVSSTTSVPFGERSAPGLSGGVQVYLDGVRMGDIEHLRAIPESMVYAIRHYDPLEAQARFGIGHNAGAIQVLTHPDTGTGR